MRGRNVRQARQGVSAVIGEIMLVAITVVLAIVLFIMVSAPTPAPSQGLSLVLQQSTNTHNATNASRNDTTMSVTTKLGTGELYWNDSTFQTTITSANGTLLSGYTIEINETIRDGKAGSGDRIIIRGMTSEYHDATLRIVYQGRIVFEGLLT